MPFNVIIPTFQRPELLERTLLSLEAAQLPDDFGRVIVVENGRERMAASLCGCLATRIPLQYLHLPQAGKGRSVQHGLEQVDRGFVLFLDDDVRIGSNTLLCYSQAIERHGRGHFFGGPLRIDYEVMPSPWLLRHLPHSVTGWALTYPGTPLQGSDRFLGANFGVFVEDVRRVGGFSMLYGPGAQHAGTAGNPTGLELDLQDRLLAAGLAAMYVQDAEVWHYVPQDRCSPSWALHRTFRNEFSRVLRLRATGAVEGTREDLGEPGVPLRVWPRYVHARLMAAVSVFSRNEETRFNQQNRLKLMQGRIHGYRFDGQR